jgi:hypothetical protein
MLCPVVHEAGAAPMVGPRDCDIGEVLARIKSDFDPTIREARAEWEAAQAPAAAA